MKLKHAPCYQCLLLGMCKSKSSTYKPRGTIFIQASMLAIRLDCGLFYAYIKPTINNIQLCKQRRRLAVHFLTGIDIGVDKDIYGPPTTYTMDELYDICNSEVAYGKS